MLFRDRKQAGQFLAAKLSQYADRPDVIVLALPRGGVPVAFEVATALRVPLDVFLVRKLGTPGRRELAMGAIASGGAIVLNDVVDAPGVSHDEVANSVALERAELQRCEQLYRRGRPAPGVRGRTVIVVDDGAATGSSMRAAIVALRRQEAGQIVATVPVAAPETWAKLQAEADDAVCAETPAPFCSVGIWYEDFSQTTDEEVRDLLDRAARERAPIHQEA
jgi:putative phosphoribosyl transferase